MPALTAGEGLFLSYQVKGTWVIQRVAGTSDPNFGAFRQFDANERIGVARDAAGVGQAVNVSFAGFDSAGVKGLYTGRADLVSFDENGKLLIQASSGNLQKVVGVGDTVPGVAGKVADVNLTNALNTKGQLAFWVKTDRLTATNQNTTAIVRADPGVPKVVYVLTHGFGRNYDDPYLGLPIKFFSGPFGSHFQDDWKAMASTIEHLPAANSPLKGQVRAYVSDWDSSNHWVAGVDLFLGALYCANMAVAQPWFATQWRNQANIDLSTALNTLAEAKAVARSAAVKIVSDLETQGYLGAPSLSQTGQQVIDLIGHSRGGAVNAEVARLLTKDGYKIDQYTALDGFATDWPNGAGILGDLDLATVVNQADVGRRLNYRVQSGLDSFLTMGRPYLIAALQELKGLSATDFSEATRQLINGDLSDLRAPERGGQPSHANNGVFENKTIVGNGISKDENETSNHINVTKIYRKSDKNPDPAQQYINDSYIGIQNGWTGGAVQPHALRGGGAPVPSGSAGSGSGGSVGVNARVATAPSPGGLVAAAATVPGNGDDFRDGTFERIDALTRTVAQTTFLSTGDPLLDVLTDMEKDPRFQLMSEWDITGAATLVTQGTGSSVRLAASADTSIGQTLNFTQSPTNLSLDLVVQAAAPGDQLQVTFGDQVVGTLDLASAGQGGHFAIPLTPFTSLSGALTIHLIAAQGSNTAVLLDNLTTAPAGTTFAPPVANDDAATTNAGVAVAVPVLLNDTSDSGSIDPTTFAVATAPAHGTVLFEPVSGQLTYTPAPGFAGTDTLTYTVKDLRGGQSAPATVTVTVQPSNTAPGVAPTLAPIADQAVAEGSLLTLTAQGADADPARVLTYSLDPGAPAGATIDPKTGAFAWTPPTGPTTARITVRVTDDATPAQSASQSFTVAVANVAPTVSLKAGASTVAGETFSTSGGFNDPGLDAPWTGSVDFGDGTGPQPLALNADKTFLLSHTYATPGHYTATVAVSDAAGATGQATVPATVAVGPTLKDIAATTAAGTPTTIDPLAGASDDAGTILPGTLALIAGPTHGSAVINSDGTIRYTPGAGYSGADGLTFQVHDDHGHASNIARLALNVVATAQPPVARPDSYTASPNQTLAVAAAQGVLANDSSPSGRPLQAALVGGPAHGSIQLNPDGSFAYTPSTDFVGTDSFQYKDNDGLADSDPVTVSLAVLATPRVASLTLGNGSPQRSMVTQISLQFDEGVTLAPGAIEVDRKDGSPVGLTLTTTLVDGKTNAVLTFSGADVVGRSLADGDYNLTVHHDLVKNAAGRSLDGDYVDAFFRLFGDTNGDGAVDNLDYFLFRSAFGKAANDSGFLTYLDFNGDGVIDRATDLAEFTKRFGKRRGS